MARTSLLLAVALACGLVGARAQEKYLYEHARVPASQATPLDEYVAAADSVYKWSDTGYANITGSNWKGRLINLTSCAWLTEAEVGSASVWNHQLVIIVPDTITDPDHGAVWITGGEEHDGPPKVLSEDIILTASLATGAGIVTASLFQIPNQPVYFADDPLKKRRIEDAVIAFGWSKFINETNAGGNPNPQYLPRLPMTKSVVRAMDTVTAFAAQSDLVQAALQKGVDAGHFSQERADAATGPSKFVVAGASKRGWTTWTTAAVDKRVVAMIPVVMDALHVTHFMHTMWQAYGGWSFALADYYALNITTKFDTPGHTALEAIVDPAAYIDRFTMPKLVIDATGDEFFMPDDDSVWWTAMPEPKKRLMVQNAEHSLATGVGEVLQSAVSYVASFVHNTPQPAIDWTISPDGSNITVVTDTVPKKAQVWIGQTTSKTQRDFRLITGQNPCKGIPVKGDCLNLYFWKATTLSPVAGDTKRYTATVPVPAKGEGWTGFLIELQWDSPYSTPFIFTTQASLVPKTLPFPDCHGDGCYGTLL